MKKKNYSFIKILISSLLILFLVLALSRLKVFNQPIKGHPENQTGINNPIENLISNESQEDLDKELEKKELDRRKRMHLELDIKNYMKSKAMPYKDVSIGYYNLDDNEKILINPDEEFYLAAGLSIPLNMMIYDLYKEGLLDINDDIRTVEGDYIHGFGSLKDQPVDTSISLSRLLSQSLQEGDNISRNILKRQILSSSELEWNQLLYEKYKVKITDDGKTNSKEVLTLFKILFEGDNEYYNKVISDMKKNRNTDGGLMNISSRIGGGNRIGLSNNYKSDVGFVLHDKKYLYVIFISNDSNDSIPKIGRIVFDWHNYYN